MTQHALQELHDLFQKSQITLALAYLDPPMLVFLKNPVLVAPEESTRVVERVASDLLNGSLNMQEVLLETVPAIEAVVLLLRNETVLIVRQMEQAEQIRGRIVEALRQMQFLAVEEGTRETGPGEEPEEKKGRV